jgi:hypothetical protein
VNTYTLGNQFITAIAMDKEGNFVITYEYWLNDSVQFEIFAQRFNRKGKAIGEEFQVNTYTHSTQGCSDIVMDETGNFVIAWSSYGQDGSGYGIFAKIFKK